MFAWGVREWGRGNRESAGEHEEGRTRAAGCGANGRRVRNYGYFFPLTVLVIPCFACPGQKVLQSLPRTATSPSDQSRERDGANRPWHITSNMRQPEDRLDSWRGGGRSRARRRPASGEAVSDGQAGRRKREGRGGGGSARSRRSQMTGGVSLRVGSVHELDRGCREAADCEGWGDEEER